MSIEYNVLNILKEHSSKEAAITLKVTDIVTYMHKDYDKSITDKQVRKALKDLTDSELNLPDEQKVIRYRTYDNERRKTDYYYNNIITDVEFKFLIDSVLYSNIFNNERALDLAGRIQTLSGKNLKDITPYANASFGRTRYAQNKNVFEEIYDYKEITDYADQDAYKLVLSHYPILMWNGQHRGTIHLYGHTHNTYENEFYQECLGKLNMEMLMRSEKCYDIAIIMFIWLFH